jgi:hypothetical protein
MVGTSPRLAPTVEPSSSGSSWENLGIVVFLSVAAGAAFMMVYHQGRRFKIRQHREDEDTNDDNFEWQDSNDAESVSLPFPWEPKKVTKPQVSTYSFREPNTNDEVAKMYLKQTTGRVENYHNNSQSRKTITDQRLDFLASMTFVNGGLRAPACPCCN